MDNQLSNYMGKNLRDIIASVSVVQGQAKESGNIYYAIELDFINGYKKRLFLKSDEQFAWVNAMQVLDTQSVIDSNFNN